VMFAQRLSTAPEPSVACGAGRWWSPSYAHQPRSATNSSAVPSSRREERRARGCSATRKHLPWVVPRARLFVFRAVGPHGRTPRALLCRRKPGRASGIVLVITARSAYACSRCAGTRKQSSLANWHCKWRRFLLWPPPLN